MLTVNKALHPLACRAPRNISSIDTDKSLKDIKPPSRISAARPSVLAVHQSAGVQKKAKRGRKSQMSAKARRRHEKGLEMAEAVIERTSLKVEKSLGRERVVKERSKTWEDVNKKAGFAVLQDEGGQDEKQEDEGWETDEDMGGAGEKTLSAPAPVEAPVSATTVPLPIDEDEEIL